MQGQGDNINRTLQQGWPGKGSCNAEPQDYECQGKLAQSDLGTRTQSPEIAAYSTLNNLLTNEWAVAFPPSTIVSGTILPAPY